ncbi:MAG TPA: hypothetical protein PK805_03455 [Acidovorax temperans]|jgi:hypothetical protein|nr:hypothetical protein [Acidovorax temperans]
MSFQLKLTSLPVGVTQYDELQFLSQCYDDQGCVTGQVDPVRDVIVGHAVAYDAVLAYLWRRLGYPNAKQEAGRLARYVLNTPRIDMYLLVEPTLAGRASQVFSFVAPTSVQHAAESYRQAEVSANSARGRKFWMRERNLQHWKECDPLTPYARAAARTLQDLLKPVRLEEGAIDLFGECPRTKRSLNPAILDPQGHVRS